MIRPLTRHAELVSAPIGQRIPGMGWKHSPSDSFEQTEQRALKQVQGDEMGLAAFGATAR
jgi:hypothetical protein